MTVAASNEEPESSRRKPRRFRNPQDGLWHVQLTQGDTYVSKTGDEVLTTILGSCIAACIRDPANGIGGMNHFLLPDGEGGDAQRYGVNAMELLINGLLRLGCERSRLEAKLFGGANVIASMASIGHRNATFAEKFLATEGIKLVGGDTRGKAPRRIQYNPATGRARQLAMAIDVKKLASEETAAARGIAKAVAPTPTDVEFF